MLLAIYIIPPPTIAKAPRSIGEGDDDDDDEVNLRDWVVRRGVQIRRANGRLS